METSTNNNGFSVNVSSNIKSILDVAQLNQYKYNCGSDCKHDSVISSKSVYNGSECVCNRVEDRCNCNTTGCGCDNHDPCGPDTSDSGLN